MTRLRMCLLGAGGIAERHAQAATELAEQVEIAGVCATSQPSAERFAARHGAKAYSDFDSMIERERPDLLIVAIPPFAHSGQVERAARQGIHLLVEKPIALDLSTAISMVEATEASSVVAACGFMYRFGDAVTAWDDLSKSGATGRPGHFSGHFHCRALHADWWRSRAHSGGQMVEQLIHIVDLCRVMLGSPQTVYARSANLFHRDVEGYDIEDVSGMILGYDDGRVGVLHASNIAVPGRWQKGWQICAEAAVGRFTDFNTADFDATSDEFQSRQIAGTTDVFIAQLRDVLDAITLERRPRVPLREGLDSLAIVLAARQSADEGREIRI
jgi:predicted dehydrogenase